MALIESTIKQHGLKVCAKDIKSFADGMDDCFSDLLGNEWVDSMVIAQNDKFRPSFASLMDVMFGKQLQIVKDQKINQPVFEESENA
jgi:hypothetical protein